MEPLLLVLVPGVLGGVVLALLVSRLHVRSSPRRSLDPPSPGVINMARIPVDGIGGLGLVAMALVVAIFVPSIRLAMATALVSGTALAAVLIARRRRGPLPSGSDRPGAHTIFVVAEPDDKRPPASTASERDSHVRGHIRVSPVN